MGEVLPDGSVNGYSNLCWNCGETVSVNIQGQGTCTSCGSKLPKEKE